MDRHVCAWKDLDQQATGSRELHETLGNFCQPCHVEDTWIAVQPWSEAQQAFSSGADAGSAAMPKVTFSEGGVPIGCRQVGDAFSMQSTLATTADPYPEAASAVCSRDAQSQFGLQSTYTDKFSTWYV